MLARVVSIQRQEHGESSLVRVRFSDSAETFILHLQGLALDSLTNRNRQDDKATVSVALRRICCDETKSEAKKVKLANQEEQGDRLRTSVVT
jgi:hypothetical protein